MSSEVDPEIMIYVLVIYFKRSVPGETDEGAGRKLKKGCDFRQSLSCSLRHLKDKFLFKKFPHSMQMS